MRAACVAAPHAPAAALCPRRPPARHTARHLPHGPARSPLRIPYPHRQGSTELQLRCMAKETMILRALVPAAHGQPKQRAGYGTQPREDYYVTLHTDRGRYMMNVEEAARRDQVQKEECRPNTAACTCMHGPQMWERTAPCQGPRGAASR